MNSGLKLKSDIYAPHLNTPYAALFHFRYTTNVGIASCHTFIRNTSTPSQYVPNPQP